VLLESCDENGKSGVGFELRLEMTMGKRWYLRADLLPWPMKER
jgi:hypothetical protein